MNKRELTKKQNEVYQAIREFYAIYAKYPTLEEIGDIVGISSRSGVLRHLQVLEEKEYISRTSQNRGITLKEELSFSLIPILGFANAGEPLAPAVEENIGTVQIDDRIIKNKGDLFGVIISGDSMNHAEINGEKLLDGKLAIVDRDAEVVDEDIVLAIIDNAATIKVLKKSSTGEEQIAILKPQSTNSRYQPIYVKDDELFLNGKVVMVLDR